jgi:hypothetical protein
MIPDMEGRDVIAQPIRSPNRHRRMKLRDLAISYPTDSHTALPLLASARAWASLSKMPIPFFCHVNDRSPPKVQRKRNARRRRLRRAPPPIIYPKTPQMQPSQLLARTTGVWGGAWGCQFRMEARVVLRCVALAPSALPFGCPSALCYVHVV